MADDNHVQPIADERDRLKGAVELADADRDRALSELRIERQRNRYDERQELKAEVSRLQGVAYSGVPSAVAREWDNPEDAVYDDQPESGGS
jgi:hypothetical protein